MKITPCGEVAGSGGEAGGLGAFSSGHLCSVQQGVLCWAEFEEVSAQS